MAPQTRRNIIGMIGIAIFMVGIFNAESSAEEGIKHEPAQFEGLWKTSFGPMRLRTEGKKIEGVYNFAGGLAPIVGEMKNNRFNFRYKEANVEGEGWFELSDDGSKIHGKWRANGQPTWRDWVGDRSSAQGGRVWLIVLEANWETEISQPEYAFGEMLKNYFSMASARHIQVRHRFFHDATDLERFCREIQFLPEPVVLLISTHGTNRGITVNGQTIGPDSVAECLVGASNLRLVHLSGCAMMSGDFANQIHASLGDRATFPISGYKTNVAWDASAIGDFTFLSMMLIRKNQPEKAAQHAISASPYLGTERVQGSAFKPLGLTVLPAPSESNRATIK